MNGHWIRWTPWGAFLACISKIMNNKRNIMGQELAVVGGSTIYRIDCGETFWVLARDPFAAIQELRRSMREELGFDPDEVNCTMEGAKCKALTTKEAMGVFLEDDYGGYTPLACAARNEGTPAILGCTLY